MIEKLTVANLGPIKEFDCQQFGKVNLLIGNNGMGKTILMKALYATQFALERNMKKAEKRSLHSILFEKLSNVYMSETLGDLVTKGESALRFKMQDQNGKSIEYSFGKDTKREITNVVSTFGELDSTCIFIPAKEIISIREAILDNRSPDMGGDAFDDTYLDLANALRPTKKGRNVKCFAETREVLNEAIGGRLDYDKDKDTWYFYDNQRRKIHISLASEGIKKMSVLDVLLGNHYLKKGSIIFIDEVEEALHPTLISKFMEMIVTLAYKADMQFFITTHSYTVVKKLYILAQRQRNIFPCISFEPTGVRVDNLTDDMPENEIVNASIELYEEELGLI